MSLLSVWMILQATAEVTDNLTNLTNEVTDHTNEFSFFMDDLIVEVTETLLILQMRLQSIQMSLLSLWMILQMRLQMTLLVADHTNKVTECTNEFTFCMDDPTAEVTDTLLTLPHYEDTDHIRVRKKVTGSDSEHTHYVYIIAESITFLITNNNITPKLHNIGRYKRD
jgi:hypothetical protein